MLRNSGFELSKFVKTLLLALSLPDFRLIFSMSVCHIVVCLVLVLDNKDIRRLSGRFFLLVFASFANNEIFNSSYYSSFDEESNICK